MSLALGGDLAVPLAVPAGERPRVAVEDVGAVDNPLDEPGPEMESGEDDRARRQVDYQGHRERSHHRPPAHGDTR
jgi:hypothetical protein